MTLAIGERYRSRLGFWLEKLGVSVFWLPDNPDIDPRLAGHADLSVCRPNDHTVAAAPSVYPLFVNLLTNKTCSVVRSHPQGADYPMDAGLCICNTGRYSIFNSRTVDPAVLPYLSGTRIDVSQGYTNCSVCVVSDNAIITADDVIAYRASIAGMDVLQIAPGQITLEGYADGFIGGASFLLDEHTMAFTGDLDAHTDKYRILRFLDSRGVKPVFLTKHPIFDIGGAVSLP